MYFAHVTNGRRGQARSALAGGVAAIALFALAGVAQAEPATATTQQQADAAQMAPVPAPAAADDSLTYRGVTLYGTLDAGVAYQSHGTPLNRDFAPGLEYLVSKNGNKSQTTLAPNGLSQSSLGLKGDEEFVDGYSAIFKLEAGFDPLSGHLADGTKSMAYNNGRALTDQTSNGDSSRNGQIFNGAAYAGVKSKNYGTLTVGRQNGLLTDNVSKYDPQGGSYAFSVVGDSLKNTGIGDTQDARLNSSLKYNGQFGPARVGAQYQPRGRQYDLGSASVEGGSAAEFDLGGDYKNLSADVVYSQKKNAIGAAALAPGVFTPTGDLTATQSDNSSIALMAKYTMGAAKIFGGYEHIRFSNSSDPLPNGSTDTGGYILSSMSNTSYNKNKLLDVYWTGVKYAVTEQLDVTGAYYGYSQNSFATGVNTSCASTRNAGCSGNLNAVSLVADYKFTKHFDVYGGAMLSQVQNGLASGYLHDHTIDPMVGARLTF